MKGEQGSPQRSTPAYASSTKSTTQQILQAAELLQARQNPVGGWCNGASMGGNLRRIFNPVLIVPLGPPLLVCPLPSPFRPFVAPLPPRWLPHLSTFGLLVSLAGLSRLASSLPLRHEVTNLSAPPAAPPHATVFPRSPSTLPSR